MSDKPPALPADTAPVDDDAPPAPYRPNPKVAVVVAGAALAVTVGLTILVIPYARQAAKIQAAEAAEFALKEAAKASRAAEAGGTGGVGAASAAPEVPLTFREKLAVLRDAAAAPGPQAQAEPVKEETDEVEEELEPVSPWLGFQALGIATAIVGLSAGLGVWGAAKWLGVNSMEEFAARMRGSLEQTYPELVAQVRREGDEAPIDAPDLLTRHGEFNEPKFDDWIRGIEAEEAAAVRAEQLANAGAASAASADAGNSQNAPANYGSIPEDSRVLAELAARRAESDVRLV